MCCRFAECGANSCGDRARTCRLMCSMIAATTAALRDLLRSQILQIAPDMADLVVTAEAPGRARAGRSVPQFNVFLFYVPADRALQDRNLSAGRLLFQCSARR